MSSSATLAASSAGFGGSSAGALVFGGAMLSAVSSVDARHPSSALISFGLSTPDCRARCLDAQRASTTERRPCVERDGPYPLPWRLEDGEQL